MDALSEVLTAIRLDGAMYISATFTEPWCVEAHFGLASAASNLPPSDHIAYFHVLIKGRCRSRLVDESDEVEVKAGDVLLFPHDDLHLLGSHLDRKPTRRENSIGRLPESGLIHLKHGGGGPATQFVCGYLACDRHICRPLLNALPRLMRVSLTEGAESSWLLQLLEVGLQQSTKQGPGARSMLAKLSELMFVEAMRRYADTLPPGQKGWLAGLRDAQVGRALTLLHTRPAHPWSVEELAREVAMSRSALADRFVDLIGEPPMQYLTSWRLALAAQALRSGNEAIARVAERFGYESESSFNRAFKREFAVPPATWRRQGANGPPPRST